MNDFISWKNKLIENEQSSLHAADNYDLFIKRFKTSVNNYPDKRAIVFRSEAVTYKKLDEITDILASKLCSLSNVSNRIAVAMPQGLDMVVCIISIFKAGKTYIPIGTDIAEERIKFICKDSNVSYLLTPLTFAELNNLRLEATTLKENKPQDIACIFYTSGSTGIPKGVIVTHESLGIATTCPPQTHHITKESISLQFADISFITSLTQMFCVLAVGGTLIVPTEEERHDPVMLWNLLNREKVSFMIGISSIFALMPQKPLPSLKTLILGGERMIGENAEYWRQHTMVINGYGQTENTVSSLEYIIKKNALDEAQYIGVSSPGVTSYIVDDNMNLLPPMQKGKLMLGGRKLTPGYINRQDLNEKAFHKNPFVTPNDKAKGINTRLFDTGDLAMRNENGDVIYCGRADQQIKINGHRIELGEVESGLRKLKGVTEAAAKAVDISGVKRLVGYVKTEEPDIFNTTIAREELSKALLDYMVPSAIVALREFPRTTSGKIDRKNLPVPTLSHIVDEADAPQTTTEKSLAEVWKSLLGIDNVGRKDNFTKLGGESIMTVHLSFRIEDKFGVRIKVSELFRCKDLEAMAKLIESSTNLVSERNSSVAIPDEMPLPPSILSLWTECSKSENMSVRYNLPFVFQLPNGISTTDFEKSIRLLIDSCDALRATIVTNGKAMPQIRFSSTLTYEAEEVLVEENTLDDFIEKISSEPFDFSKALFKCYLLRISDGRSICLLIIHHLVADGWSWGLISNAIEKSLHGEEPNHLGSLAKYILEENKKSSNRTERIDSFWNDYVKGSQTLDIQHSPKSQSSTDGNLLEMPLPTSMKERVNKYCSTRGITQYSFYYSIFTLLLYRLYGKQDFLTTFVSSGRDDARWQNVIGYLVHPLLLRFKEEYVNLPFSEYILQLSSDLQLVQENLTDMLSLASICRKNGIDNIADISFNMTLPGEETRKNDTSMFKLSFEVAIHRNEPQLNIEYQKEAFSEEELNIMAECYFAIIDRIVLSDKELLKDIEIVSNNFKECIIAANNLSFRNIKEVESFMTAFERYADSDKIAIVENGKGLSYKSLHTEACSLVSELQTKGMKEHSRVAISLPRSANFIITAIAIWKCKCSYIPLDLNLPTERQKMIIEEARPSIIIENKGGQICINFLNSQSTANEDEAYIIYTSGTTGRPKGIPIKNAHVSRMIYGEAIMYDFQPNSCALQFANVGFDASVTEIFTTLASGATLVIANEEERHDPNLLANLIEREHIDVVTLPPAIMTLMPQKKLPSLRTIVLGGESTPLQTVKRWYKGRRLFNSYGPTESTVDATCCLATDTYQDNDIGLPMPAVTCYVLDDNLNLVPDGFEGELYIGGLQLTEGYINRPELNEKVFVANPYVSDEDRKAGTNLRLYKSGDKVIRRSNGHLIFRGRTDNQVKLRGFRIELGEIESVLTSVDGVSATVCKVVDENLVAYVQADISVTSTETLRDAISTKLPQYMIPTKWAIVERFPLTINGKIDFSAMIATAVTTNNENDDNLSLKEQTLVDIASSIVGVKIGVNDDLFLSGMTSLQVIRFIGKAEASSIHITVSQVYEKRNIRQILSDATVVESFWYNELDESKPVLVLFSGYVYYAPFHSVLLETFKNDFSIYIVDSYTEFFYGCNENEASVKDLINHYTHIVEKIPLNGQQLILTGYCLGAEIAIRVASMLSSHPMVINMEGIYHRSFETINTLYPDGIVGWKFRLTDHLTSQFSPITYNGSTVHFFCTEPTAIISPEFDEQPQINIEDVKKDMKINIEDWQRHYPDAPLYLIDCNHYNMMQHPYVDEVLERTKEYIDKLK